MKTTWVIQTNMGSESDIRDYVNAVKKSGANVIEVDYIPFSNELPKINVDGKLAVFKIIR